MQKNKIVVNAITLIMNTYTAVTTNHKFIHKITKLTVDFKFKLSVFYKLAYKNKCAISKQQTKN